MPREFSQDRSGCWI